MEPPQQPLKRKKLRLGLLGLILLVAAGAGGFAVAHLLLKPSPLSVLQKDLQASKQSFGLPIYIPDTLPKGFTYKSATPSHSGSVLIYNLAYDKTKTLAVSDQAKPKNVDFNDFYNRFLGNKSSVLSTQGKAVVGNAGNQTIGSLLTDKVWVLISTKSGIDNSRLTQLLSSLKPLP